MKIRIEDNAVRFRLRRSEVDQLAERGALKAFTRFPGSDFEYAIEAAPIIADMEATFDGRRITIRVPQSWIKEWPDSPQVGFETRMEENGLDLHLLVEKDFVCLDRNLEDQKDQYPNPKQGSL